MRPAGVQFSPTSDPLWRGAMGINRGFNGVTASQFLEGWDKPKGTYNNGLCGQTSIAAILRAYADPITIQDLVDIYYHQAIAGKIIGAYAATGEHPDDDYINYTAPEELASFINFNMGAGHADPSSLHTYISNPDQWRVQWAPEPPYYRSYGKDIRDRINGWLRNRRYPIITVRINGSGGNEDGGRVASGPYRHWVVITGISQQFSLQNPESAWNWIRIYNPFHNRTEYYWFSDIFSNWITSGEQGGSGGMVLMNPGQFTKPYYPEDCQ